MPKSEKAKKKPKELKGKAEQAAGKVVGSKKLMAKGKIDETEARSTGSITQGARKLKGKRS
ncbi:CsbD family protein [Pseudonocardia sp. KRD291]|uniref:CsbD family protein n=1 Tax=Pseudonocardia sp. KRD291 TaxID=2792007 RepID=UPI001C4A2203|nr:CsbD family protein [Pseudonocardia sp. KRD291]MBW0105303.1 CsbD family protein [Pseudonocardia sp. KRD291]